MEDKNFCVLNFCAPYINFPQDRLLLTLEIVYRVIMAILLNVAQCRVLGVLLVVAEDHL